MDKHQVLGEEEKNNPLWERESILFLGIRRGLAGAKEREQKGPSWESGATRGGGGQPALGGGQLPNRLARSPLPTEPGNVDNVTSGQAERQQSIPHPTPQGWSPQVPVRLCDFQPGRDRFFGGGGG